jgi:hypothetical protein
MKASRFVVILHCSHWNYQIAEPSEYVQIMCRDNLSDKRGLKDIGSDRRIMFNPFRSYVGPRPTLWFSCLRRFSWSLTLSNPIFLPPAYSPALIYFGRQRGWWITCNYPTVLKEKNINRNRKSTTCAICCLKSVLHEEKRREQDIMIFLFPTLFLM